MNKCIFTILDNILELKFEAINFSFNVNENNIDATNLITYISNLNSKIEIDKSNIDEAIQNKTATEIMVNASKFLCSICTSFNNALDEVENEFSNE